MRLCSVKYAFVKEVVVGNKKQDVALSGQSAERASATHATGQIREFRHYSSDADASVAYGSAEASS